MSLAEYLKEKLLDFFIGILCAVLISGLLIFTGSNPYAIAYSLVLTLAGTVICISADYLKRRNFYKNLLFCMRAMDKLYLLSEMVSPPGFYEGNVLCEALKLSNKAMNDQIALYKNLMEEYREYIESWVHEIKTPIASGMLIVENNQSNAVKSIGEEIEKIDAFVEQALFYSRSSSVEKDYIIKEQSLRELVLSAVRRNSKALIQNKVLVEVEDFDFKVYTDSKWIDFILNQIISNSVKYKSENPKIKFSAERIDTNVSLFIEDNGIGISQKDVVRVFEKGFTGENGRKFKKSTGIGLYLCKKLCEKLGLSISISSKEGEWTRVGIVFPMGGTHLLS
jgi:hypothetical protein